MPLIRRREQPRDSRGRYARIDPDAPRRRWLHVWLAEPEHRYMVDAAKALDVGYTDLILAAVGVDDRLSGPEKATEAPEALEAIPDKHVVCGLQLRLTDNELDTIRKGREKLGLTTRAFLLTTVRSFVRSTR